jgi:two-component sensor histidine kinase
MRKYLSMALLLSLYTCQLFAQENVVDVRALLKKCHQSHPDTTRIQLLLQLSSLYVTNPANIQRIQDSALLMAVQAKQLSKQLKYKRGEMNAAFGIGQSYIATNNITAFRQLLPQMDDTSQIKLMVAYAESQLPDNVDVKSDVDSAIAYSYKAIALSEKIHSVKWKVISLLRLANAVIRKGNNQLSRDLLEQAFNFSRQNNYVAGESGTYQMAAFCFIKDTTILPLIEKYRTQMLADYKKKPDITAQHAIEDDMVNAAVMGFWSAGRADLTEKELLRAIDFGQQFYQRDVTPHYNLVFLYLYKADIEKALFYALDAVKAVEKTGNKDLDERPYMNLGKVYSDMRKWDASLLNYNKAVSLIKQKGFLVSGVLLRMIAEVYTLTNRPAAALPLLKDYLDNALIYDAKDRMFVLESMGNAYYSLGQYETAEKYLQEGATFAAKSFSLSDKYNLYEVLGKVYVKTKQYDKARYYLQSVLNDSTTDFSILKRASHLLLSGIDSAQGNYQSALVHYINGKIIDDSLFKRARTKQIEELTIQYETEKKDKDIKLLKKQTQLQTAEVKREHQQRNFLIAGAGMLILLLILLYSRYNIKKRSNQLLQVQYAHQQQLTEEKEWLIKEVHHRVKNNLQMIISLLHMQRNSLPDEKTFEELSTRIHTISLIHQKLYQVHDLVMVNMREYIEELIKCLDESGIAVQRIKYELQIDEIELDASQSVSVGLILNEAVTNAMKHAFKCGKQGVIQVSLKKAEERKLLLSIRDNGNGLPDGFEKTAEDSIGIELMEVLSEQLDGDLSIENDNGVHISLLFTKQARIVLA